MPLQDARRAFNWSEDCGWHSGDPRRSNAQVGRLQADARNGEGGLVRGAVRARMRVRARARVLGSYFFKHPTAKSYGFVVGTLAGCEREARHYR